MKYTIDKSNVKKHAKDTGSSGFQIVVLTERINQINEHLKKNPKDHAGQRGVMVLIGKRRSLCKYIERKNKEEYKKIIEIAGLRK